jgi:uncharacterized protein (DUF1684 family)
MSLAVLDWRRRVSALYREVRAADDPAAGREHWVAAREYLFRTHPASPNRSAVLRHAPYDPSYRFAVAVDTDVEPARLEIATGTDGIVPFQRTGRVHLEGLVDLDVWWLDSYGGGIWLPLRDGASDTYGGGRYLLDTVKGADLGCSEGRLVVDLNFAYNPSCAYDEQWACPLAPAGNVTYRPLEVGELLPG